MHNRQPLWNALLVGAAMTLICASGSAAGPNRADGGEPGGTARDDTAKQGGNTGQAADPGVWADSAASAGPANQGRTGAQSETAAQGATAAQVGTRAQSDTAAQGETVAQAGSTAGAADGDTAGEEAQASRAVSEPEDRGPDLEWVAKQNRETTELNKQSVARMRENMSEWKSGS